MSSKRWILDFILHPANYAMIWLISHQENSHTGIIWFLSIAVPVIIIEVLSLSRRNTYITLVLVNGSWISATGRVIPATGNEVLYHLMWSTLIFGLAGLLTEQLYKLKPSIHAGGWIIVAGLTGLWIPCILLGVPVGLLRVKGKHHTAVEVLIGMIAGGLSWALAKMVVNCACFF